MTLGAENVILDDLLGDWLVVDRSSSSQTVLRFCRDGRLDYVIESPDATQIIRLSFTIDGDWIVTDQRSSPRIERTRFVLQAPDTLLLEKDGERTLCKRQSA